MSTFPISHWMENLTFDDKGAPCAVYKIPMDNYSLIASGEVLSVFDRMAHVYETIERDFKILSFCREVSPSEYQETMNNLLDNKDYLQEYNEHIFASKAEISKLASWKRELYIIIPLKTLKALDVLKKNAMKGSIRELKKAMEEMFLGKDPVISKQAMEKSMKDEEDMFIYMEQALGGRRATNEELQWILNRLGTRSITSKDVVSGWSPTSIISTKSQNDITITPIKNTIMSTHYSYEIDSKGPERLAIRQGNQGETSFQTFIQFSDYPDDTSVPGHEVYFNLERLGYPIDIAIEAVFWDSDTAGKKLYGKNLEMIEQSNQYSGSLTGAPIDLKNAHQRSKVLEHKISEKMPLLNVSTTLAISATDEVRLKQMRREVTESLKGYYAVVAPGKQREAYMQFMPVMTYGMKNYQVPMEPKYLASTMINATVEVGERVGYYLGIIMSGNKPPLLFNPTQAQKDNKTATTAILGNLGGGKSVLNKTIIYYMVMWGAKVIAIDPKDENKCFKQIPAIAKRMRQVDIGVAGSSINPYRIANSPEATAGLVVDFLCIILNANEAGPTAENRRIAIQRAVAITMEQKIQNMETTMKAFYYLHTQSDLADRFKQEAETCFVLLQDYKNMEISNTVFSDDDALDIKQMTDQFVNFNISKLPLPTETDMQNLGTNGRLAPLKVFGSAIMYLIVQFARYATLSLSKRLYKVLSIDEGWKITSSPQGADLMMEIIRMGRTYNIMPIIATQSASDLLDEKVRNNIGMVFMFKNKDEQEIRNCAKLLGIEDCTPDFIAQVRKLRSGTCYFRDLNDRVCKLIVRPQPANLIKIFDTRPEAAADLEEVLRENEEQESGG
jgi:hypothetical protein